MVSLSALWKEGLSVFKKKDTPGVVLLKQHLDPFFDLLLANQAIYLMNSTKKTKMRKHDIYKYLLKKFELPEVSYIDENIIEKIVKVEESRIKTFYITFIGNQEYYRFMPVEYYSSSDNDILVGRDTQFMDISDVKNANLDASNDFLNALMSAYFISEKENIPITADDFTRYFANLQQQPVWDFISGVPLSLISFSRCCYSLLRDPEVGVDALNFYEDYIMESQSNIIPTMRFNRYYMPDYLRQSIHDYIESVEDKPRHYRSEMKHPTEYFDIVLSELMRRKIFLANNNFLNLKKNSSSLTAREILKYGKRINNEVCIFVLRQYFKHVIGFHHCLRFDSGDAKEGFDLSQCFHYLKDNVDISKGASNKTAMELNQTYRLLMLMFFLEVTKYYQKEDEAFFSNENLSACRQILEESPIVKNDIEILSLFNRMLGMGLFSDALIEDCTLNLEYPYQLADHGEDLPILEVMLRNLVSMLAITKNISPFCIDLLNQCTLQAWDKEGIEKAKTSALLVHDEITPVNFLKLFHEMDYPISETNETIEIQI